MRRLLVLAALATAAVTAAGAFPRVRLGGGGYPYGYYGGPFGYYGGPFGYYGSPFWYYGPFAHPGFYSGYAQGVSMGEVQIKGAPNDALVFLDGAYAGEVRKLKSIWLEPGVYQLEVRDGTRKFERRIYVLSGKKLDVKATPAESAAATR